MSTMDKGPGKLSHHEAVFRALDRYEICGKS